jgi:Fuc2NAc and GlcNAc transferase
MDSTAVVLFVATAATSMLLTYRVWRTALARGLLDVPNERSSHSVPTPRGGGVAIVVASTAAFILLGQFGRIDGNLLVALLGGTAVAIVGFVDDRRPLSASVRLAVHFAAALWAMGWLGGLPSLRVGDHLISFGLGGYVLGTLGIVWTLNLFNFMDGIDGIAGSEAVFITWGAALLQITAGFPGGAAVAAAALGSACFGFLIWNWPPARIFMGDVGSGYLGYVIAVLALASARTNPVGIWLWLILGGVFFVDATVTLIRRLSRGERLHEAHRSHAYQWLARRWGSHAQTTAAVVAVNLLWLLPCAWFVARSPGSAPWLIAVALLPMAILVTMAGAGRSERSQSRFEE